MAIFSVSRYIACLLMSSLMASSQAHDLDALWRLRVMDWQHNVKVEATIRFTAAIDIGSCIGGNWKRIVVVAKTMEDEKFFPLSEQLVYELDHGALTLGRTHRCDSYLILHGTIKGASADGDYNSEGWASKQLGYFSLKQLY